jgi:hypothetical protein
MGQLKSDGRSVDVTAPAAQAITFGDLYRIDGWTGFAGKTIGASDTVRGMSMEVSPDRIWYCAVPAAVSGARGTLVYWSAGAGFKRGTADLTSTVTGSPVGKVEEARDANGVAAIRVINGVDPTV